jgi:filamentous hemagglutinin
VDETLANEAIGITETPGDWVWHHVEDGTTMELIPNDVHRAVRHTGGASIIGMRDDHQREVEKR